MKYCTLIILCIFSFGILAQSSNFSQKVLLTKRTATWCPNCGAWGWDFAEALDDLDHADAILIRAHYSGDLQSQAAIEITENFNASYQPEFYINNDRINVGSTDWEGKVQEFKDAIDQLSEAEPRFSLTVTSVMDEDKIKINVASTVLMESEGDYYLAAYLLENGVVNQQASQGSAAVHDRVLRATFTDVTFGEQIGQGTLAYGTSKDFDKELIIEGSSAANRTFEVLAVVWKKEGNVYLIENIHAAGIGETTGIEEMEGFASEVSVIQNGSELIVEFDAEEEIDEINMSLYDVSGQLVLNQQMSVQNGMNVIRFPIENLGRNQIYILKIGNLIRKKLFVY